MKKEEAGKSVFQEIPGMLFYKNGDSSVFDATAFLESAESKKTVDSYFAHNIVVLSAYAEQLGIEVNELRTVCDDGNEMLHSILAIDFAAFVVPVLRMYIYERARELFLDGFTCSERYLIAQMGRFGTDFLQKVIDERQKPQESAE